ncbi:MAG: RNA-binding protein [Patescibacteria group bacterium]
MRLYVGNLPYTVNQTKLEEMFSPFGTIVSASVISDKFSGRSKGFGFVEFDNDDAAKEAIAKLDGTDIEGRPLRVNEAKPREENSAPRSFGGGGGSRGGFGGGRGGFSRGR